MKKENKYILFTYEDTTDILKKSPDELMELSLEKKITDTNEADFGKVQMANLFDELGNPIEK